MESKNILDKEKLDMLEELIDLLAELKAHVNDVKLGLIAGA